MKNVLGINGIFLPILGIPASQKLRWTLLAVYMLPLIFLGAIILPTIL